MNEFHLYVHLDSGSGVDQKLDRILTLLNEAQQMDATTQAKLDALNAQVTEQTTIEQSVEMLLNGLSAQIAALKNNQTDPAVLDALDAAAALVKSNNDKFKAAVIANTPAE